MDARERLRHYLEQRRELGESEFVLDGLSTEDALRLIGVKGSAPPAAAKTRGSAGARGAIADAPAAGDWRAALRGIGAAEPSASAPAAPQPAASAAAAPPPQKPGAGASPAVQAPRTGRFEMPAPQGGAGEAAAAHANAPAGISIGLSLGDIPPGAASHLESLEAVAGAVAACKLCSLHVTATNPVPGEGNPNAGFVCVGEAPGATEDETGRPFVGAAGQLLTKILGAIQFTRENVFICNVLKHRPPGNRNPSPDEIAACSPYLLRQLGLLQPRVILALGTFAAQTLLQTSLPLGKLRGQVHRYYGVPLIVTYHPAALLRNPSWKRPTWEDVQLARRIFDHSRSDA